MYDRGTQSYGESPPYWWIKRKINSSIKSKNDTCINPQKNYKRDLKDIPNEVKDSMKIVAVNTIDEVLKAGLVQKMLEEKELEPIQIKSIKTLRKPNTVINNFFTLITIAIMSIVIIWYVNFVLPGQKISKEKENQRILNLKILQEKQLKRQKQIELSKKLNAKS